MKSSRGNALAKVLVVIVVVFVLMALLFPAGSSLEGAKRAQARNDVVQIITAMNAFKSEYGHYPATTNHVVDGDMLAALMGHNDALNPRRIIFIEVAPVKKRGGGLTNGTFVDPWNGPYRIAFASGTNHSLKAGTNDIEVRNRMAVWNVPPPETNHSWWSKPRNGMRYVTSWDPEHP